MKAVITAAVVSAAVVLQGCNVYIDVPVTVGPAPSATPIIDVSASPDTTPVVSPDVTPDVTPIITPTEVVVPTDVVIPTEVVTPTALITPTPSTTPEDGTMQVRLQWTPPLQREDGTTLLESELAEYVIRYKEQEATSFEETRLVATNTNTTLALPAGSYSFEIAVVDTDGLMSDFVAAASGR